jgi:predicted RNA methylase
VPTPQNVVDEMLTLANVTKDDAVYDLGSGDGRLVITAVKKFGAKRGFGVDIDPDRAAESNVNAKTTGVTDRVRNQRKSAHSVCRSTRSRRFSSAWLAST